MDSQGHAIYGLHASDFVLEDNGIPQAIHLDDASEDEPVSIVIALQTGRSAPYEYARMGGLASLIEPVLPSTQNDIAIISFDDDVRLVQDFTTDPSVVRAQLNNILSKKLSQWYPHPKEGGAAIFDAVSYAIDLLNKVPQKRQRILLLLSETRDHGSHLAKFEDFAARIGNTNVVTYSLAFSPSRTNVLDTLRGKNNDKYLPSPDLMYPIQEVAQAMRANASKEVARLTGGEYAVFTSKHAFETRINDLTNHLHSRYLLSFEPSDRSPGVHRLQVKLVRPKDDVVIARNEYWAQSAPK